MKDHRFIELLNLYIDQQISPAEAVELETEMQANPSRRQTYRQYCQMHHATKLVYASFRNHAAEQPPADAAAGHGTITSIQIEHRQRRVRWSYYAGGLAAAACLTLVVARFNFSPVADHNLTAGTKPEAQLVAVNSLVPSAAVTKPIASEARSGLVSLHNGLNVDAEYPVMLAALRQQERSLANSQIPTLHLQPLFDDGVFDNRQLLPQNSQRIFRGRGAANQPATTEFTAFQFQR